MKEYDWNLVKCDPLREPKEGFYVELVEYTLDGSDNRISDDYIEQNYFDNYESAKEYWEENKQNHYILFDEIAENLMGEI
jgi:hypothetical protein